MLRQLGALPRRIRWALQRWNSSADQAFHDSLFSAQQYDPFTFAYPGYVTIRRFADLAESHLDGVRHAADFGCGPGEITCELARRRPEIRFTGVDHSKAAIARATEHAERLGLKNVTFVAADLVTCHPEPAADLIMMFDAFHHLLDPRAFVRDAKSDRFFLIEPGGDWLGGWQKTLELDWIANALETVRARIVWQMGGDVQLKPDGTESQSKNADFRRKSEATVKKDGESATGEPVEHRYTLGDLKGFFSGFGLTARGTIAGIESYPPDPYGHPPLRERFGRVTYDTLVAIEDLLVAENLDLHAKHWAIYAERGAPHALRAPRAIGVDESDPPMRLQGPYDVEYVSYDGSAAAAPAATILAGVSFRNKGWRTWRSDDRQAPVLLSYHWLDANGAIVIDDGLRTPLPRAVAPGDTCSMTCRIETPSSTGHYTLAIDLVDEGVTWFSRAGARVLKVEFEVG